MKQYIITLLVLAVTAGIALSQDDAKELFEKSINSSDTTEKRILREKIIEISPESYYGYFARAWFLSCESRDSLSCIYYTKAIESGMMNCYVYNNRGLIWIKLGLHMNAVLDFTRAIEFAPDEIADAYAKRGYAYMQNEDYANAIEDFNTSIRIEDTDARSYYNRAECYLYTDEYEKSIEDYTYALKLEPEEYSIFIGRGFAYKELKKYAKSIDDFTEALKYYKDDIFLLEERAGLYDLNKDYEPASIDYSRIIELSADNTNAYIYRGSMYIRLEEYDRAVKDETKAIKLDTKNFIPYLYRAIAYDGLGETGKALADLHTALKLNPDEEDMTVIRKMIQDLNEYSENPNE